MTIRVGTAKLDITPPPGLPMAGYLDRKGFAIGAHDPLFTRVLYIDYGYCELIFVLLDLIRVEGVLLDEVRKSIERATGIKNVFVAATHTHSGPEVSLGMWATQDVSSKRGEVEKYIRFVANRCASASLSAMESAIPAEITLSKGLVKGVATNRIDPRKPVDEEVAVASIWGSNRPLAILANFACHPTVLGAINTLYSSDFFGYAAQEIEEALGSVTMITNGAAGNVSTRFSRLGCGFDEVARMGRKLASSIIDAILSPGVKVDCDGCIDIITRRKKFKVKTLPDPRRLDAIREDVVREIDRARKSNVPSGVIRALLSKLYAIEVLTRRALIGIPSSIEVEISVVKLSNRFAAIMFPGELFVEYQLEVKKRAREKGKEAIIVGYANGYLGYVPHKSYEDIECYETMVSLLDPEEYVKVEEFLVEAIAQ